eukprot:GHRR01006903.1.p1 GENE.GHRR01006903.1~~GHRR01006903.1.p1  ORF type:complete len:111 (+),score=15.43 GHRR01006903.1:178-510(+)
MSYRDDDRGGHRPYRNDDYDRDRGAPRSNRPLDAAPKIFVGNIPYDVSEDEIRGYFERIGKVTEVLLPRDVHNNGRTKGYGFVTFEDFDSMDKAIDKVGDLGGSWPLSAV